MGQPDDEGIAGNLRTRCFRLMEFGQAAHAMPGGVDHARGSVCLAFDIILTTQAGLGRIGFRLCNR
jgi:hypothetical protein